MDWYDKLQQQPIYTKVLFGNYLTMITSVREIFDIVLILDYFRSAAAYLCIIKYLSPQFRIGLYLTPTAEALIKKNGKIHDRFVRKCTELGSTIIDDRPVDCRLLIVQQHPYPDHVVQKIMTQIRTTRRVGYLALAFAGTEVHDRFLKQFQIDKVYVPNRRFFDYLLHHRQAESIYSQVEVEQVGLPFASYPLFPEFEVDYLIASPTSFSFHSERDKHIYLHNVLKLLNQIDPRAIVAYKPHNATDRDYFQPRGYSKIGPLLARLPRTERFLQQLSKMNGESFLKGFLEKALTSHLFSRLLQKVVPMSHLTPDNEFALEAFLPGVKQGVIGGLSNTIWGTLYFSRNFYNCVDDSIQNRKKTNPMLGKNSSNLLDLNLGFFYVPCCHGQLDNSQASQNIVTEEDRWGDLIKTVQNDLQ